MFSSVRKLFEKPSADVLAMRELEDSKRELLNAQRHKAYYAKLAEFYAERIKALDIK